MSLKNRQQMAHFINERMNKTHQELKETRRLEVESSSAKTYLIEAHLEEEATHDRVYKFLYKYLTSDGFSENLSAMMEETQEEKFFVIRIKGADKNEIVIYIDATDTRFWRLHSMDKSTYVDRIKAKPAARVKKFRIRTARERILDAGEARRLIIFCLR